MSGIRVELMIEFYEKKLWFLSMIKFSKRFFHTVRGFNVKLKHLETSDRWFAGELEVRFSKSVEVFVEFVKFGE